MIPSGFFFRLFSLPCLVTESCTDKIKNLKKWKQSLQNRGEEEGDARESLCFHRTNHSCEGNTPYLKLKDIFKCSIYC